MHDMFEHKKDWIEIENTTWNYCIRH